MYFYDLVCNGQLSAITGNVYSIRKMTLHNDIVVKIIEFLAPERKMINKVITVCRLLLFQVQQRVYLVNNRFPPLEDLKHIASLNSDAGRRGGLTVSAWTPDKTIQVRTSVWALGCVLGQDSLLS